MSRTKSAAAAAVAPREVIFPLLPWINQNLDVDKLLPSSLVRRPGVRDRVVSVVE